MQSCVECGASAEISCAELFEHLLALDHARTEPWGSLHGVVVACYRLQHPSTFTSGSQHTLLELVRAYRDGGTAAAQRWTAAARRANSHRRDGQPHTPPALHAEWGTDRGVSGSGPPDPTGAPGHALAGPGDGFAVTIADVSVDGTFPAPGYSVRVDAWVDATLAAWGT